MVSVYTVQKGLHGRWEVAPSTGELADVVYKRGDELVMFDFVASEHNKLFTRFAKVRPSRLSDHPAVNTTSDDWKSLLDAGDEMFAMLDASELWQLFSQELLGGKREDVLQSIAGNLERKYGT